MPIYKIIKNKVSRCGFKEEGFGDEFHLRDLFADNLEELIGVRFIAKEYPTLDGRIDTLGLDENNSPVIIEYKWKENEEILAQGKFYFSWLIKNKRHFELLVEKILGKNIKVNWEQPRVILIARGFGKYIVGAVDQEKNVELIAYSYYEPDILHLEAVYTPKEYRHTNKPKQVLEKGEYDLDYHLNQTTKEIQQKFDVLRQQILNLPDIKEKVNQKTGITYRTTKSFVRFEFHQSYIYVLLRDASYTADTKKIVKDVTKNLWGFCGMIRMAEDIDTDYLFNLIKLSYESTQ